MVAQNKEMSPSELLEYQEAEKIAVQVLFYESMLQADLVGFECLIDCYGVPQSETVVEGYAILKEQGLDCLIPKFDAQIKRQQPDLTSVRIYRTEEKTT